ncbi:MAG: histidinol dehydrogenase [Thermoanaerobacterales bacterium]|nr:histidinol dehydrogenase [Thermoanaerobacterales bacterium]
MLRIIPSSDPSLADALQREFVVPDEVCLAVADILTAVRERGDRALAEFTARFDGVELAPEEGFRVSAAEVKAAYRRVEQEFLDALRHAKERIAAFHRRQLPASWFETSAEGIVGGQLVRPLDRVGIYVPGGRATYPSSVLMNALPAAVAGVREIAMVTPPARDGSVNPYTLVAAAEAGITEIYKAGGAQAVAALAFGTESIRRVDKITGPGNIYVTVAKQQVFGLVGIDMLAGPSEVVIVADGDADPAAAAADLLAQAEHDVLARAVLITPSWELAGAVREEVARQLGDHRERRGILEKALADGGLIIVTRDLEEAVGLANRYAPEHLELMVGEPLAWLGRVRHAGAVFLGGYTPVALGDYAAGPNHVLPTGGTARFTSALGVDAFLKRINVLSCDRDGFGHLAPTVAVLAEVEGLPAHAAAVLVRGARGGKEGRE